MAGFELQTAKYFVTEEPERDVANAAAQEQTAEPSAEVAFRPASRLEQAAAWTGVAVAGLVVICLALVAVPMITGIKLPKGTSPVDWWLWFGGAKSEQTFDKFIKDAEAKNQQDFAEMYRKSPMYQFQGIQPIDMNKLQGIQQFNNQPQRRR